MEENESRAINWPAFFLVTAFSTSLFSSIIKFVDGNFPGLLLSGSLASFVLSIVSYLYGQVVRYNNRRKNEEHFSADRH